MTEKATGVKASVVVATYRRNNLLRRCLIALILQDYNPEDYEIIIVDDGASPETHDLVQTWARKVRVVVRYIAVSGNGGPASARNTGWRAARGEFIAFTDDDCVPDPGWLRSGIAAFTDDVEGVRGRLIMPLNGNPTDYQLDAARLEGAEFVTANCMYRRTALERIGGFDERFTAAWREDSDVHFSLLETNSRLAYAPDAVVVHPVRPAPWGISISQQRKSMFNALLYKKHPRLYRERIQPGPPWRYYAIVMAIVCALAALLAGHELLGLLAAVIWLGLTLRFCLDRLEKTSHSPGHVAEMVVTSVVIPPLSIFWRLFGAVRFRVFFL